MYICISDETNRERETEREREICNEYNEILYIEISIISHTQKSDLI